MTIEKAKERLIDWANKQIGYKEGSNNYNKYAENADLQKLYGWKPQNEPWCDTFVDCGFCECFGLAMASKLTYQPIGKGSAACRYSAGFYSANEAFYNTPQVGDQIFFYYEGGINHTGIVTSVSGGLVHTVEGNTSDTVARRVYSTGSAVIAGYGRPDWTAVITDEPKEKETPVITGLPMLRRGDKGEVVRAAQFLLNGRKCSCGIWGADGDFGPSTEAAVLAFQRRNGLEADGIIGPATWAVLLGVSDK
jgi:hypothetical protein